MTDWSKYDATFDLVSCLDRAAAIEPVVHCYLAASKRGDCSLLDALAQCVATLAEQKQALIRMVTTAQHSIAGKFYMEDGPLKGKLAREVHQFTMPSGRIVKVDLYPTYEPCQVGLYGEPTILITDLEAYAHALLSLVRELKHPNGIQTETNQ